MKFLKYLKYVVKHKYYVFIECCKLGIPLRGILHDLSKFRISEFIPYMNFFYGEKVNNKKKWNEKFSVAWLHHIHRNKHHWQYWLLNNDDGSIKIKEMPLKHRKEMLADWIGAGKAIHGKNNICEWYASQAYIIKLGKKTKKWIEEKIKLYKKG